MSSPYKGEGRGIAMLNLLRTLSQSIAPSMADMWEQEIPLLVQYLEGEGRTLCACRDTQSRGLSNKKLGSGGPQQDLLWLQELDAYLGEVRREILSVMSSLTEGL